MSRLILASFLCLVVVTTATPQQQEVDDYYYDESEETFTGPVYKFTCPERNGLFADPEQCDLYYHCKNNVSEAVLCPDGHLFDDSIINREKCVLPYNVKCGDRKYVQAVQEGIDPRCKRANGFFEHEDPSICSGFYECTNGVVFEKECPVPLVFDVTIGNCRRPENTDEKARKCSQDDDKGNLKVVDGFQCPGKETVGPTGLLQAHPSFAHPQDCQFFFTCFFGKDPNKFGCKKGQVFDPINLVCKLPEEVPACSCWYACNEDSLCPNTCNKDCTCPSDN